MILNEGMRAGDLEDLVLPMISVDEFESKINKDAIVFGFYVHDHDAAHDLNRFVQKSPASILDTEVSPAPDQRGFYVVFFEVLGNARLPHVVAQVLDEVSPLVSIEEWEMQVRGEDDLVPFSEQALAKYIKRNRDDDKDTKADKVEEHVLSFLHRSQLSGVRMEEGDLVLEGLGSRLAFEIVDFGGTDRITEDHDLAAAPMNMNLTDIAREVRVGRMLGEGWAVTRFGSLSFIQRDDADEVLLLRDR